MLSSKAVVGSLPGFAVVQGLAGQQLAGGEWLQFIAIALAFYSVVFFSSSCLYLNLSFLTYALSIFLSLFQSKEAWANAV